MKKTSKSWIAAGLLTIVATITTIYCLLEYRSSVLMVGISSLFLLASAFWLFLSLSKLEKNIPTPSVGEEQRERMNYEGMKLQGEELIRLVNTLGKGTYVYSKRSSEHLEELLSQITQNQQANEALIQSLMQEQTKAAKFQVKYKQDDTSKVIATLTANFSQINENLDKCIQAIASRKPETSSASNDSIATSLTDLSKELACINNSIQALQLQLTASVQQPIMYAPVQPQPMSAGIETSFETTPNMGTATSVQEPSNITEPENVDEVAVTEEAVTEEPVIEEPVIEEPVVEEPVVEEPVIEEPVIEESVIEESVIEEPTIEASIAEEPTAEEPTDISSIISDDPNKQLSADEIAALFAALG